MKVIELTSFACMYLCTSSNRSYNMIHLAQDQQGIKCDHICCPYEINRSCSWDTYFIYQFYFALSHSWLVLYLGIVFVRCLNVWLSTTKPPFCIKISSESKVCISTNRCKYLSSPLMHSFLCNKTYNLKTNKQTNLWPALLSILTSENLMLYTIIHVQYILFPLSWFLFFVFVRHRQLLTLHICIHLYSYSLPGKVLGMKKSNMIKTIIAASNSFSAHTLY